MARDKRKFDASTPSEDGELRIRLDTARLGLEREHLGHVKRSYEGINALALLMSERHPDAVRPKHAHWALSPAAAADAGLDIISVAKPQQWETPWEVWDYVAARWCVDFDACASPLNALAPRYASSTDDFLAREDLTGVTIFCNPPYSLDRCATGSCAAIGPIIGKLVDGDVCARGCTVVAFVPVLAHQRWFHEFVTGAASGGRMCHEVHWIEGLLKWNNPFHETPSTSPYPYPFALCVWRPGEAPVQQSECVVALTPTPRDHHSRFLHLRRCTKRGCGKVRMLSRYVDPQRTVPSSFTCADAGDTQYASCDAHEFVMHFT